VTPETRYVKTPDGVYIAYQVVGDGPVDVAADFHSLLSNVDLMWEEPIWRPFMTATAEIARLILHDRRGLGESSRNVPAPNLETRAADLLGVLDAVGADRPILAAAGPTGAMHMLFAATHPDRVGGVVWNQPMARAAWAPDYPWGEGPEDFERNMRWAEIYGTPEHTHALVEELANEVGDPAWATADKVEAYGRIIRNTCTPDVARQVELMWWDTDIRAVLPAVQAPVALITGTDHPLEHAQHIAGLLPNATLTVVEGHSGTAVRPVLDAVRRLAGLEAPPPEVETVLTTVLFTDIVDSTARQAALGDRGWRDLVVAHHGVVREALRRWRGVEADTAGDGFYATFDGPARAIKCAQEVVRAVRPLGVEVRAGVHTGECEVADGKCTGLTVSIGARVAAAAGPSQVVVSQTVRDLVAGSGLTFTDLGERELKGVPGVWRLHQAG
jgi:class 3 adenylate cyclase